MLGNDFIDKYYPTASETKIEDISRWTKNFNRLLKDEAPEKAFNDEAFLCRTFYITKSGGISRGHYQKAKDYLKSALDFYGTQANIPTREKVICAQEKICYFKDLKSVINFIDSVGSSVLDNYNKSLDLLNLKSLVILIWHGFRINDLAEIKVTDIKCDEQGFYVLHEDKTINITQDEYKILQGLTSIDSIRGLPSGRTTYFNGREEFLFRSKSPNSTIDESSFKQLINRFNNNIGFSENALSILKLRKNAMFVNIFNDNSDEKLINKIAKWTGATSESRLVYGYKKEYEWWLSLYH